MVMTLAITNLVFSATWIDQSSWERQVLHDTNRKLLPLGVWCLIWLVAGLGMIASVIWRKDRILLLSAGTSFAASSAVTVGVMYEHFVNDAVLSPVGIGIWLWLLGGQASVILPRLFWPDREDRGRE